MAIDGTLFSAIFLWLVLILYGIMLALAMRLAPWGKFRDAEQLHVFLGAIVSLLVLWHMRADVFAGGDAQRLDNHGAGGISSKLGIYLLR